MKRIFLLYQLNLTTVTLINDEPHLQNEVSKNRVLLRTFLKPRYIKFTLKECETPKQNAILSHRKHKSLKDLSRFFLNFAADQAFDMYIYVTVYASDYDLSAIRVINIHHLTAFKKFHKTRHMT